MIYKSISTYLLFYCVLKSIALFFVSSNIHAATMDLTNNNLPPSYTSFLPPLDKEKTNSFPIQNISTDNNTSNVILSNQHSAYIAPTQYKPETPTNNPFGNIKTFLDENADNTLLQDSLLVVDKTRELFKETDNILNNMTQHMLLELDQYYQLEPLLLQNNIASGNFSYINHQENYMLAAFDQNIPDNEIEFSLLKEILRIKSLYYIFALIIVAAFFKWILTLLLLGKYK